MKAKLPKRSSVGLLALATMIPSPEFGAWVCGGAPRPHLHSPENIARLLDWHLEELESAAAKLNLAKAAVQQCRWRETRQRIKEAFAEVARFESCGEGFLRFVEEAGRSRGRDGKTVARLTAGASSGAANGRARGRKP